MKNRRGGEEERTRSRSRWRRGSGWVGGRATLTPHTVNSLSFSSDVLTDILEAGIHRSIIKIHTADSKRIQLGIMMPHHLHTDTQAHTHSRLRERQGRQRADQEARLCHQQDLGINRTVRITD